MKQYSFLRILILTILPLIVFLSLNKYFYGNFSLLGMSAPDLRVLDSAQSLEGAMPIHVFKKDKKLLWGKWHEKIQSQQEFIGKALSIYPYDSYPSYIAKKAKERNFELKYKQISQQDASIVNEFYFAHSPYLLKKMQKGTYPTSYHASGTLYVFLDAKNEKIYGVELDSETENDFGTHETMLFKRDRILSQHVRNIARDADMSPMIVFLGTGIFILGEIAFVYKAKKWLWVR